MEVALEVLTAAGTALLGASAVAASLLVLRTTLARLRPRPGTVRTPFKTGDGADGDPGQTIWYPPPLQQVSPTEFVLTEPFRFRARDGRVFPITEGVLGVTDYASIPWFLRWFISRYGAHSLAAVMHDQLVDDPGIDRREADRYFNEALDDLGVPPVRRHLMWSAVTLATRFGPPWGLRRFGMLAWSLLAAGGVTTLVVGLVSGPWWLVPVALAAPLPAALLWGPDWWNGVVGGYGLVLLAPATLAVVLTYVVYWLTDPASKPERVSPSEL